MIQDHVNLYLCRHCKYITVLVPKFDCPIHEKVNGLEREEFFNIAHNSLTPHASSSQKT